MIHAIADIIIKQISKKVLKKVVTKEVQSLVTEKITQTVGTETLERAAKAARVLKTGKKIYNTAKKIRDFDLEKEVDRIENPNRLLNKGEDILNKGIRIHRDMRSKSEARKIIEQGMRDIEALEDVVTDNSGMTARREVRLADVKKAIADFPDRQRYTEKQLANLRKMFNFNRLKAHTNIYVDFHVERVVPPEGDYLADVDFTNTIRVGTLSQSPETRVRNLGRELNKQFASFAALNELSQDQLGNILNRLPDKLIKDPSNPSLGINISQLKADDVDTMLDALQQTSEIAGLPRNVSARNALEDWQLEGGDAGNGGYSIGGENEKIEVPWFDRSFQINFSILYDTMQRMIDNLDYNSDEEKFTHQSYYSFRSEVFNSSGDESMKEKFMREVFMLFATNHPVSPNIRGTELNALGVPEYGPDARPGEMPHLIDQKKYELKAGIQAAYAEKLAQFRRG